MSNEVSGGGGQASPNQEPARRRGFLGWLIGSFLSLWGLAGLGVVFSFLKTPETGPGQRLVPAGSFSDMEVGHARLIRHGSHPLYVVKVSPTEVVALSAVCTHRQCVLDWSAERKALVCPCHAGAFDVSGNVTAGLPRQRLDEYRTTLRRDEILVHLT